MTTFEPSDVDPEHPDLEGDLPIEAPEADVAEQRAEVPDDPDMPEGGRVL